MKPEQQPRQRWLANKNTQTKDRPGMYQEEKVGHFQNGNSLISKANSRVSGNTFIYTATKLQNKIIHAHTCACAPPPPNNHGRSSGSFQGVEGDAISGKPVLIVPFQMDRQGLGIKIYKITSQLPIKSWLKEIQENVKGKVGDLGFSLREANKEINLTLLDSERINFISRIYLTL